MTENASLDEVESTDESFSEAIFPVSQQYVYEIINEHAKRFVESLSSRYIDRPGYRVSLEFDDPDLQGYLADRITEHWMDYFRGLMRKAVVDGLATILSARI